MEGQDCWQGLPACRDVELHLQRSQCVSGACSCGVQGHAWGEALALDSPHCTRPLSAGGARAVQDREDAERDELRRAEEAEARLAAQGEEADRRRKRAEHSTAGAAAACGGRPVCEALRRPALTRCTLCLHPPMACTTPPP